MVLRDELERAGLGDRVAVSSAGTGPWHAGEPMDPRAARTLRTAGLDPSAHVARQFGAEGPEWDDHDLVLAMDAANLTDLRAGLPPGTEPGPVRMFRAFDPAGGDDAEVPDPYDGGQEGFAETLVTARRTSAGLTQALARELAQEPSG